MSLRKAKERLLVLKKVLLIVISMFCAVSVWAVSYASPYKGAGRNGGIYLTSGVRHATTAEGMAQTPQIAMSSVSRGVSAGVSSRGIVTGRMSTGMVMGTAAPVRGIYTSATDVTGGVTTYDTSAPHRGHIRRTGSETPPPGPDDPHACPGCVGHYEWDPEGNAGDGDWYCTQCGHYYTEGCTCATEEGGPGYCWCPLDMNWGAMLFLALLAGGYAMWKKKSPYLIGSTTVHRTLDRAKPFTPIMGRHAGM